MSTFNATCTIDIEQAFKDDLAAELSKSVQEEIDFSIVRDILVSTGWTEVIVYKFSRLIACDEAEEVISWLRENCQGHYRNRGEHFVFELAQDATAFSLKWA